MRSGLELLVDELLRQRLRLLRHLRRRRHKLVRVLTRQRLGPAFSRLSLSSSAAVGRRSHTT